jgi:hypothetical protein
MSSARPIKEDTMNARNRIAAGAGSAVLVLGVGAGLATTAKSATGGPPGQGDGPPPAGAIRDPAGPDGPGTAAIGDYLGLTQAQLKADLQDGQSLAQIAVAQGKAVSGLEAAIVADARTHLDAAVAAGKLTSSQEVAILADLSSHVADRVNSTGPPPGGRST